MHQSILILYKLVKLWSPKWVLMARIYLNLQFWKEVLSVGYTLKHNSTTLLQTSIIWQRAAVWSDLIFFCRNIIYESFKSLVLFLAHFIPYYGDGAKYGLLWNELRVYSIHKYTYNIWCHAFFFDKMIYARRLKDCMYIVMLDL